MMAPKKNKSGLKQKRPKEKSVQDRLGTISRIANGDLYHNLSLIIKDKAILEQALTHKSYATEHRCKDNQRLEFLGDAVLELAISDLIYKNFREFDEGKMSLARSRLVDENGLYKIACKIGLPELIKLGKSEKASGGKQKKSIVADCFEAVVGAIYLEAGFDKTKKIIHEIFGSMANGLVLLKDPKTRLQELSQKLWKSIPKYTIISVKGPKHNPIYTVSVEANGLSTEASGKSIKESEENAAMMLLDWLKNEL